MKTKLQFIALASLAVMGAGCLAVTTGIMANEKEELSINAADRLQEVAPSCWTPGNTIYFAIKPDSVWITNAMPKFAIYFWDNAGHNGWTDFLTQIADYNLDGYDNILLYYGRVPEIAGVNTWNGGMKVGRFDPMADKPVFGNPPCWNEGDNITDVNDNSFNGFVAEFNVNNAWDYTGSDKFTISPEAMAGSWAGESGWWGQYSICDQDGNTDYDQLKANWEASAVTFATLGNDVQGFFSNVVGVDKDIDNTATYAEQAAFQYDYIVRKYGFDDFAHRL